MCISQIKLEAYSVIHSAYCGDKETGIDKSISRMVVGGRPIYEVVAV
jgi:hypothetical protein